MDGPLGMCWTDVEGASTFAASLSIWPTGAERKEDTGDLFAEPPFALSRSRFRRCRSRAFARRSAALDGSRELMLLAVRLRVVVETDEGEYAGSLSALSSSRATARLPSLSLFVRLISLSVAPSDKVVTVGDRRVRCLPRHKATAP